ncbi:MAG: hypothetical protein WC341_05495 [Bacteroidales bacterium]
MIVNEKTGPEEVVTEGQDWLTINMENPERTGNQCNQLNYYFVPALLYWEWNSTIACDIDPVFVRNYFEKAIYKAADSLGMRDILGNRKVTINLTDLPGKFLYENKGTTMIFIFAYSVSTLEGISPSRINLVADFTIHYDNETSENGQIIVQNLEMPVPDIWNSTKRLTGKYLDKFKVEIERMSTELVEKIIEASKKTPK